MKKLIYIAATIGLFAACNNEDKRAEEMERTRQATIDSMNTASRHQRMLDSMTAASPANQDAVVIESPTLQPTAPSSPKRNTAPKKTTPTTSTKEPDAPKTASAPTTPGAPTATGTSGGTVASGPDAGTGTGTVATEEKKKKGLNNAAKGAIIGLGTGAAAGAVINKENRGKGAVIGGVIGAVGGAVGGAVLDKRKAKKEAEAKDTTDKK